MTGHILEGTPPVPLVLRKTARARRMTLRVSAVDGQVTLTMPKYASEREALEFAELKADWIRGHLENHQGQTVVDLGMCVPIDGEDRLLVRGDDNHFHLNQATLLVPTGVSDIGGGVEHWIKSYARKQLTEFVRDYADLIGRRVSAITLRDTRSRWGSCTSLGRIMLSWRLAMAPLWVQSYVAAHEAAHLVEMNHSSDFWDLVEHIYGDHTKARAWLHDRGIDLHRYKFRV